MSATYSLKAVLEQGEKLMGADVSIDAALIIQGGEAYLVESVETPDSLQRIPVHCPGLELKLDLSVGGWMGGKYSYIDPVKIDGKLQVGTVRKNRFVLSDVTELTMIRDGEFIPVLLGKKP
jgi:hypothetical protein